MTVLTILCVWLALAVGATLVTALYLRRLHR